MSVIEYPEKYIREDKPCELKRVNMIGLLEASKLTGLSYDHLRNGCINGTYVHIKSGNKYLINYDKLLKILNGEQDD